MAGVVGISEAEEGKGFDVRVDWAGFDGGESSWEPLATIWNDTTQIVNLKLRKLRLDRGVRSRLRKLYGITL